MTGKSVLDGGLDGGVGESLQTSDVVLADAAVDVDVHNLDRGRESLAQRGDAGLVAGVSRELVKVGGDRFDEDRLAEDVREFGE